MADPRELLRQLDELEKTQKPQRSAQDMLRELDEIEGGGGSETVFVADNGGRVMRSPKGMFYKDDVWSTSDPESIERIMAGESPADVSRSNWDQETISRAPVAARVQEFVRGFPAVGSRIDELAGVVKGPEAERNAEALSGAMRRENPIETLGLNLSGTVTSATPVGMAMGPRVAAAAPQSRGMQALLGMLGGGTAGAIEGALYQSGEEGGSAGQGALFGAATGGALGLAAPYANAMLKNLVEWGKKTDVDRIAAELGISASAAATVRDAFRADDIQLARQALKSAGDDAMLADAGRAARELLDAATTAGGQAGTIARGAVEARAAKTSTNLTKALDDALGVPFGQRTSQAALRDFTKGARKQAYDAAYSSPIDYASSGGRYLEDNLKRVPQSAIKKANDLMKIEGIESKQILAQVADDGSVEFFRQPDVQQMHYILQGLDDAIESAKGAMGRNTTKSRALSKLRTQLSNTLKRQVPAFKKAQDIAADTIRAEKAVETGYGLLRPGFRMEMLDDALDGASRGEIMAMKQGVRSYLDDTLANVSRTVTDPNVDAREAMKLVRDLSSRASRMKLNKLLGTRDADKFLKALEKETISLELRGAIAQNSKTAIRQSIQAGVRDRGAPNMVQTLAAGEPVHATQRLVQVLTGETAEARQLREMGVFEDIASALTGIRGKSAERALTMIEKAIQGQPLRSAEAEHIAQTLVASGAIAADRRAKEVLQP